MKSYVEPLRYEVANVIAAFFGEHDTPIDAATAVLSATHGPLAGVPNLLLWFYDEYVNVPNARPEDVAWWDTLTDAQKAWVRS